MDEPTISHFDRNARSIAVEYEAADMREVHDLLFRYLPRGKPVLEIGSGSGRDAAFLAESGFDITAVDASAGMVSESALRHPVLADRLVRAEFPMPSGSPLLDERFGGVVSIATVMHIPNSHLFEFAMQLRELVEPGGILIISSSIGRGGLPGDRDENGRLLVERPPKNPSSSSSASASGLSQGMIPRTRRGGILAGTHWSWSGRKAASPGRLMS